MIILIIVVLGLCFGSFINALVWRLHEQTKKSKIKNHELSIIKGRSMCPHCYHELAWYDLVPVLSWLQLRGKCRYCRKPIPDSPLVELVSALLFILSYLYWPMAFDTKGTTLFVFWLIFLIGLIALDLYDLKWLILPNKITYLLTAMAFMQSFVLIVAFSGHVKHLEQILLSAILGGGIFYFIFQVSSGKWIGGGDVKLGLLIGLLLADPGLTFLVIFIASLLGTAFSLPLIAANKLNKTSHIPFGPFLIMATIIARLFGLSIIAWYKRQFLLI